MDPYHALTQILSLPTDAPEQVEALRALRPFIEVQPQPLVQLCPELVRTVASAEDSLYKRWVLELFAFALTTNTIPSEHRASMAIYSLAYVASILNNRERGSPAIIKLVIQCLGSMYPLIFRTLCASRTQAVIWEVMSNAKHTVLELIDGNPKPTPVPNGVKLAALKFAQRVILVQTRGVTDPRLQNRSDVNIAMCPTDHPFINATQLETEGGQVLTLVVTLLYTSPSHDIVSAILNTFGPLARVRPTLIPILVHALTAWTPASMAGQSTSHIKSAEKAVGILLGSHVFRQSAGRPFANEISAALQRIVERIDELHRTEHVRRAQARAEAEAAEAARRRASEEGGAPDAKRVKLEHDGSGDNHGAFNLDRANFEGLDGSLVTELIVQSLAAFSDRDINSAISAFRASRPTQAASNVAPQSLPPVDPLKMDEEEEELEYEPERLNRELELQLASADANLVAAEISLDADTDLAAQFQTVSFELAAPKPFSRAASKAFVRASIERIITVGSSSAGTLAGPLAADSQDDYAETAGRTGKNPVSPGEMWVLLMVRMATRGASHQASADPAVVNDTGAGDAMDISEPSMFNALVDMKGKGRAMDVDDVDGRDGVREMISEFVLADFPNRLRYASMWMHEEWYNDNVRGTNDPERQNYQRWLLRIITSYRQSLKSNDTALAKFLLDLPFIPLSVLDTLRELCLNPTTIIPGFTSLRELAIMRPPVRADALKILLDLTTHPETNTRIAAINTVKKWVPDVKPLDMHARKFAVRLLRRLEKQSSKQPDPQPDDQKIEVDDVEEGEEEEDLEPIQTLYLPEKLEVPISTSEVLQHVQLLFALSVKAPDLLDEIFSSYARMDESTQLTLQELLTPLIRSLGSSHGKLLTLLRTFTSGAESLALRVLTILTDSNAGGRPSPPLVALVKSLITERNLDARFLIPIIAELDKSEIERQLPKIVGLLNGTPDQRAVVRGVFSAIVQPASKSLRSEGGNLPRVGKEAELVTAPELLVLLHDPTKGIEIRNAIEAIGICFSMTDLFTSDVFAVAIQRIVDNATLPKQFMRTVIQAVTTYKSLVQYVAQVLLTRLIQKSIWRNGPLWDGFVLCAMRIAPASYPALLQLPTEQLREVVQKQPTLKAGLREYIISKSGTTSKLLDALGGAEDVGGPGSPSVGVSLGVPAVASPSV